MNSNNSRKEFKKPSNDLKKNILIATIPVVGSIIIALISQPNFKCKESSVAARNADTVNQINQIKLSAGKINEDLVFKHYDDVRINMVEGLKPFISREVFETNIDSIRINLGNFLKTLDTNYSKINGTDVVFIRNQYERGIHLVQIIFDGQGKIFGLFSTAQP